MRTEIARQIVEEPCAIFLFQLCAPAEHLVDLAIPVCSCQALLSDEIIFVADAAAAPERGGLGDSAHRGRWCNPRGRPIAGQLAYDDIVTMTDEMIAATAAWLPQFAT